MTIGHATRRNSPHLAWNLKIHYCAHKSRQKIPTLSQTNPVHIPISCSINICYPPRISDQNILCAFLTSPLPALHRNNLLHALNVTTALSFTYKFRHILWIKYGSYRSAAWLKTWILTVRVLGSWVRIPVEAHTCIRVCCAVLLPYEGLITRPRSPTRRVNTFKISKYFWTGTGHTAEEEQVWR
jgi:hypothetical protein